MKMKADYLMIELGRSETEITIEEYRTRFKLPKEYVPFIRGGVIRLDNPLKNESKCTLESNIKTLSGYIVSFIEKKVREEINYPLLRANLLQFPDKETVLKKGIHLDNYQNSISFESDKIVCLMSKGTRNKKTCQGSDKFYNSIYDLTQTEDKTIYGLGAFWLTCAGSASGLPTSDYIPFFSKIKFPEEHRGFFREQIQTKKIDPLKLFHLIEKELTKNN